jgi:3-oxoadipate enol-lactonase
VSASVERGGSVRLANDGQVQFSVLGAESAPPILLNRPLGGSMSLWGEFAQRLGTTFRVVMFDPLGVGQSSAVPLGYTTRAMARDALQVLDHLGIESAHVFGLSLGGMVASFLALDFPARVRTLTLASTIPEPDAVSLRGAEKLLSLAGSLAEPRADVEVALVRRILSSEFRAAQPERVAEIERRLRETPATRKNLAILAFAAARHWGQRERLPSAFRTLLLFGELDVLAGAAARAELIAELPNAVCEIIPDAGHDLSLEQPTAAADRIIQFALA